MRRLVANRFNPLCALFLALVLAGCGESHHAEASGDNPHQGANGNATAHAPRLEPSASYLLPGDTRTFTVTYTAKVKDIPEGTKQLRVWVPVPSDSTVQSISDLSFDGPVEPTMTTEKRFGNKLAYFEVANPGANFETDVSYEVTRKETKMDLDKLSTDAGETDASVSEYLKPDKLVVVDDRIRKIASETTEGKTSTLEKARAIYHYVADHMAYDKSGTGWGRGDTNFACEVGKGNCTDFHSLFISLCRAQGIPAGFAIGLFPPTRRTTGKRSAATTAGRTSACRARAGCRSTSRRGGSTTASASTTSSETTRATA